MKKAILTLCISSLFLTGCVTTQSSQEGAQQQKWQEKNIKSNINALNQAPQYKGKIRVTSEVNNGEVLLMGQAIDDDNKQSVEGYVQNLQGVKKTYNQIRIGQPIAFDQISYDIWLTTRVKSALLSENRLDKYSVKVTTENKEVFLTGNIPAEEAQIAADIARKVDGVTKVVKAFKYVNSTSDIKQETINKNTVATSDVNSGANDNSQLINDNNIDEPQTIRENASPIFEEPAQSINEDDVIQ
ncbi:BON domain-containing protein [Vibrio rumoiensis]|uniref:BON domain-containing protein n=1 Tax=Vibrio rumoiensis TaxID=76258 RepID=A0ABW7ISJ4_9VIBR|nr:BON domain-containing protein [Vibrio rumoiensis]